MLNEIRNFGLGRVGLGRKYTTYYLTRYKYIRKLPSLNFILLMFNVEILVK